MLRASDAAAQAGSLRAVDMRGRPLAETTFQFTPGAREVAAKIEAPLEIRNDIARVEIVEQTSPDQPSVGRLSAGAVQLLDGRAKRRRVGVISGESADTAQPLLSPVYFVTRALGPFADVREAPRGGVDPYARLIEDGAAVLVLTDVGTLTGPTLERLRTFVENGGVLIRFASRRPARRLPPMR